MRCSVLAELTTAKRASETELRRLSPKGHNAKKFHVSSVRVIFAYFIQRFLLAITYILQPLNLAFQEYMPGKGHLFHRH